MTPPISQSLFTCLWGIAPLPPLVTATAIWR
jgi:hypothetical protein